MPAVVFVYAAIALVACFFTSAAGAPSPMPMMCAVLGRNRTIQGHNTGSVVPATSAGECCNLCNAVPSCKAAVFFPDSELCQRKSGGTGSLEPHAGALVLLGVHTTAAPTTTAPVTTPSPPFPSLFSNWTVQSDANMTLSPYFTWPRYLGNQRFGIAAVSAPTGFKGLIIFDATNGQTLFQNELLGNSYVTGVDQFRLILTDEANVAGNLTLLNASTYETVWTSSADLNNNFLPDELDPPTFYPVLSATNDVIFGVGSVNGNVGFSPITVNATTGAVLWSQAAISGYNILAAALPDLGIALAGNATNNHSNFTAYDMVSGLALYSFDTGAYSGTMVAHGTMFYIANQPNISLFSAIDGSPKGQITTALGPISLVLPATDDTGFFACLGNLENQTLVAFTWEGVELWSMADPLIQNVPISFDKRFPHIVYVGVGSVLSALDRHTGAVIAQVTIATTVADLEGIEAGVIASTLVINSMHNSLTPVIAAYFLP